MSISHSGNIILFREGVDNIEPLLPQIPRSINEGKLFVCAQETSKPQNSSLIAIIENCNLHETLKFLENLSTQQSSTTSGLLNQISVVNNIAAIHLELGEFEKAKQLLDDALKEHSKLPSNTVEEHSQLMKGVLLNNLAYINFRFSHFEHAVTQLQTSISLKAESNSFLSEASIANSLHNQGVILFQTACYKQSEEMEISALLSAKKFYGSESSLFLQTELLLSLNDKIFGRFQKASQKCVEVIQKLSMMYPKGFHPDIATARYILGTIYFSLGEYAKALDEHEQSLEIRKEIYGFDHFMTAFSLHSIGNIAYMKHNYQLAIDKYQTCLQVRRKTYKQVTLDIVITLSDLGQVYSDLSESKIAIQILSYAMNKYKIFLRDSHPDLGTCYNNLGLAYQKDNQEKKALECFSKSFEIFENMKVCLPVMAISLMNLGAEFHLLGDSEKGVKALETSLDILQKVFPKGHPDVVLGYRNLGKIYEEMKERTKSMACYMRSIQLSYSIGETDDNNIPLILTKLNIIENRVSEKDLNGAISFLKSFYFTESEKLTDESLYWFRMVQLLPKQLEMHRASVVEIHDL